jgi:adenylate cyclase
MSDASGKKSEDTQDFSLRQHDIRALICLAAAGTVLAQIKWQQIDWLMVGITAGVFLYTFISYWFIKRRAINQNKAFDRFMTVDAAVIGVVLSFSDFNLLPTILFITMVQFNSLINGGIRKWAIDNTAMIVGIVLSFFAREPQWVFSDKLEISSISLIGIFTYFCAYALYAHKKILKMEMHIKKLSNELTMNKLLAYKLSRYVTPAVWKAITENRERALTTQRKRITVFFSDIQGFSGLAEELDDKVLTDLLNTYLEEMARIATRHKGTIDKFIGDALMVIFGDSESEGVKADCLRAVSMAIEMRRKMKELKSRWYDQGIKHDLQIRMGINTGFCTVGTFGTSAYRDYTVLGYNVNFASRLEAAANPGEILISQESYSLVKDTVICRDSGEIMFKGVSQTMKVYQVVDFRKDLGKDQSWFEDNTDGFSMHLDLEKVRNYDKDRILEILQKASDRLREKVIK